MALTWCRKYSHRLPTPWALSEFDSSNLSNIRSRFLSNSLSSLFSKHILGLTSPHYNPGSSNCATCISPDYLILVFSTIHQTFENLETDVPPKLNWPSVSLVSIMHLNIRDDFTYKDESSATMPQISYIYVSCYALITGF